MAIQGPRRAYPGRGGIRAQASAQWKRRETGYYAPAPDLKLRRKTADGETWTSIADAMNLAAVADGAGGWFFDVYSLEAARSARSFHAAASCSLVADAA